MSSPVQPDHQHYTKRETPRKTPIILDDDDSSGLASKPVPLPKKSIKLIVHEPKDDDPLYPAGYEHNHGFGGRLDDEQADTSLSVPRIKDKKTYQSSQNHAVEPSLWMPDLNKNGKKSLEIRCLHLGLNSALSPWYSAPFPAEYYTKDGQLWMCECCLKYLRTQKTMKRHIRKCCGRPPPGNEIYRQGNISVFEVNGRSSKTYCQNLCLLAKMFLDHKTLYYDVETFLFYVLVEWHPVETLKCLKRRNATLCSYSLVGYFSKEKQSPANYNLSCIMTLPTHQRKGYGYFLIDLSYLLSTREGKKCSAEKPLSDLGLVSYVSYWTFKVMEYIDQHLHEQFSVDDICEATGMTANDVLGVLEHHNFVRWNLSGSSYTICVDEDQISKFREKKNGKVYREADPECLRWIPYTCTR